MREFLKDPALRFYAAAAAFGLAALTGWLMGEPTGALALGVAVFALLMAWPGADSGARFDEEQERARLQEEIEAARAAAQAAQEDTIKMERLLESALEAMRRAGAASAGDAARIESRLAALEKRLEAPPRPERAAPAPQERRPPAPLPERPAPPPPPERRPPPPAAAGDIFDAVGRGRAQRAPVPPTPERAEPLSSDRGALGARSLGAIAESLRRARPEPAEAIAAAPALRLSPILALPERRPAAFIVDAGGAATLEALRALAGLAAEMAAAGRDEKLHFRAAASDLEPGGPREALLQALDAAPALMGRLTLALPLAEAAAIDSRLSEALRAREIDLRFDASGPAGVDLEALSALGARVIAAPPLTAAALAPRAASLGVALVAEGVSEPETLDALEAAGVSGAAGPAAGRFGAT